MYARLTAMLLCTILCAVQLRAQDIESRLATSTPGSGFTVFNSIGDTVMTVRGSHDGGMGGFTPGIAWTVNGGIGHAAKFIGNVTTLGKLGIGGTPECALHLTADGMIISKGVINSGTVLPSTGGGTKLIWYPRKAAFCVGTGNMEDTDIGLYSFGSGVTPLASGSSAVAMGYDCEASGNYSVALGRDNVASAISAVAIGRDLIASGANSMAFGSAVSTNGKEGTVMFGDASTNSPHQAMMNNRFYARFDNGYFLYTKSDRSLGVYLQNGGASWISVSDSTRKTAYREADGERMLRAFRGLRLGSWEYIADRGRRHYGPMAQEWFAAFGHDGIAVIGDDVSLASADVDGVLCIAIQALEQRTRGLEDERARIAELRDENARLRDRIAALERNLAELGSTMESELVSLRENLMNMREEARTAFRTGNRVASGEVRR